MTVIHTDRSINEYNKGKGERGTQGCVTTKTRIILIYGTFAKYYFFYQNNFTKHSINDNISVTSNLRLSYSSYIHRSIYIQTVQNTHRYPTLSTIIGL